MIDQTTDMDTSVISTEPSPEPSPVDRKKEQLAKARQTKQTKKRNRDDDILEMREMLKVIVEEKKNKKQRKNELEKKDIDEPPKQQIVTKKILKEEEEEEPTSFKENLKTQVVKSLILGVLGIASFCITHYKQDTNKQKTIATTNNTIKSPFFRKTAPQKKKEEETKNVLPNPVRVQNRSRVKVNRAGFRNI